MIRTVYGRSKSGTALIPIIGTDTMYLNISTRVGDSIITMGDGTSPISVINPKLNDFTDGSVVSSFVHNYSVRFTGNVSIKYLKGLKDVYSIRFGNVAKSNSSTLYERYNITDIETFFKQFPNLYSVFIDDYGYGVTIRQSIIKGDLAKLPNSVEKLRLGATDVLNSATDLLLNFSNYSNLSKLKSLNIPAGNGGIKISGDLTNIPPLCNFIFLGKASSGSAITYTSGKVFPSSFDSLVLPIPLTSTETDNILIDAYNSITTAIGGKLFDFKGFRTHASDIAVAGLIAKGFTVNCIVQQNYIDSTTGLIFRMDFQNNFDTYGNSVVPIIEGNSNGLPSFVSDGSGGYMISFNGTKSIKTSINLPINTSDKVTIAYSIKTTQVSVGIIAELSATFDSNNAFANYMNGGKVTNADHNSTYNRVESSSSIATGTIIKVALVIDRSLGVNQNFIYLNGVLAFSNIAVADLSGNFGSFPLFIGQRNGISTGFVGQLKNLKVFNYALNSTEIAAL